jgi:type VI secretion system protein ImpH
MARARRRSSADLKTVSPVDLKEDLLARSHAYSFFQAIRLLRHFQRSERTEEAPNAFDHIRMRPKLSLSYPPADIDCIQYIETAETPFHRITANFLGLYGAASPLPTFYTEDLLAEKAEDDSVSRDFLDIIHHDIYTLLYQGWLKYRLFFQVVEEKDQAYLDRLYCLLGLGQANLRNDHSFDYRLLRYIGIFTQFPRSSAGLVTLLRDALGGPTVNITPCVFRKAKIPADQQLKMGICGHALGLNSYLGKEIDDRMGKFRIHVGPLNQADFLRFTPGNPGYEELVSLTELFVTEPLDFDVELILAEGQAKTVCLGDRVRSVLGVTTWVFSKRRLGEVRTRFVVHQN